MRWLLAFCTAFFCIANLQAQHQETSLVDRLLRPKMELQNNAQNKKFAATNSTAVERRGTVGTFYLQPNRSERSFADARNYSTAEYSGGAFVSGKRTVGATQNRSAHQSASGGNSSIGDVHPAYDSRNAIPTREFAERRQFTEKGKSQKSLDRQNPPLTIDQVRELLNKNK